MLKLISHKQNINLKKKQVILVLFFMELEQKKIGIFKFMGKSKIKSLAMTAKKVGMAQNF